MGDSRKDAIDVGDPAERSAFRHAALKIYAQGAVATAAVMTAFFLVP